MQVVEKKNLKSYCKKIFEENGFSLSGGSKDRFQRDFGEFTLYTILHRNIEIVFTFVYKGQGPLEESKDKYFHLNGNYGAVELIFNNLDRIIDRFKATDTYVENYFFLVFLQEENHAIFTRYFFRKSAKIQTQDYFSTKVGFVDLEPRDEEDDEDSNEEEEEAMGINIPISDVDNSGS